MERKTNTHPRRNIGGFRRGSKKDSSGRGLSRSRGKINSQRKGRSPAKPKQKMPELKEGFIRIIPLGGVDCIGQNMTVLETKEDIFIIDAGFQFVSESDTPGVDYIIPNIKYVEERKDKIRGIFVTHGHLDHIGALPYILDKLGNPMIYCGLLTEHMIRKRHEEFPHLPQVQITHMDDYDSITLGNEEMKITTFPVTHSIVDSIGFVFHTKEGNIIFAGDTKLDHVDGEPVKNEVEAYSKVGNYGNNLLFLSDSTNSEEEGFSKTEDSIAETINKFIREAKSRIFIGTFASQIRRLIRIIEEVERLDKKIVLEGRSIKTNIAMVIASERFVAKKDTIISAEESKNYPPDKTVVLLTGAQGEEFAALMRISTKKHPHLRFNERDTILLSASVIPGNEISVRKLKDNLSRTGSRIVQYRTSDIHASGHGNIEELLWIQKKIGAKYFMPIHGYHSMLQAHKQAVIESGQVKKENIIVPENGTILDINKNGFVVHKVKAPNNLMVVDGFKIGEVQDVVIRDRKTLTKEGFIVVVAVIDPRTKRLRKSPDIISRGFVYLRDSQELIQNTRNVIKRTISKTAAGKNPIDFDFVKKNISDDVGRFLVQKTAKRPIVIPVIIGI